MRVSLVMPTYNRAHIIAHSIASILRQTHDSWELVVIDDGSSDNTRDVVKAFKDPRIHYHRITHGGTPRAWNLGVKMCGSDLVFLTADDLVLDPTCLEELCEGLNLIDAPNVAAIGPRLVYADSSSILRASSRPNSGGKGIPGLDIITGDVLPNFDLDGTGPIEVPVLHGYALVVKKAFLDVGGFDEHTYKGNFYREETDLWMRLRLRGYRLYLHPRAVAYCIRGWIGGGQTANVKENILLYEYFVLRNHFKFTKRFFGRKAYFMITPFAFRRVCLALGLWAHRRRRGRLRAKHSSTEESN